MLSEDLLSVAEVAKRLPKHNGRRTNTSTICRWHREGVKTPHGRIRLEARRIGGRLFTTLACVEAFSQALDEAFTKAQPEAAPPREPSPVPADRTPAQRRASMQRAEAELAAAGI